MISESLAMIPFLFTMVFAVVGGIEFGLPLLALVPHKHSRNQHGEWYSPKWEFSLLFLVVAVLAAALIYSEGVTTVMPELQTLWLVAAGLLALRAFLLMAGHHMKHKSREVHWALAAVSLILPATLIQTVTILLTGDGDVLSHPGLTLTLGAIATTLAVALWSGSFYQPGTAVRQIARRSYLAAVILVAVALPLTLVADPDVLDSRSLLAVGWPAILAIAAGGPILMWDHRRRYYAASVTLVIGTGLTLYNLMVPHLMRPVMRLDQATGNIYAQIAMIGVFVAFTTWYLLHGAVRLLTHLSAESGESAA